VRKGLEGKEIEEVEEVKEFGRGVLLGAGAAEMRVSEYSQTIIAHIVEVVNT
jgi:hypothetical protein